MSHHSLSYSFYLSLQITKLKIESNPFAKGFRDSSSHESEDPYPGVYTSHQSLPGGMPGLDPFSHIRPPFGGPGHGEDNNNLIAAAEKARMMMMYRAGAGGPLLPPSLPPPASIPSLRPRVITFWASSTPPGETHSRVETRHERKNVERGRSVGGVYTFARIHVSWRKSEKGRKT